jgi:hypothetical protein
MGIAIMAAEQPPGITLRLECDEATDIFCRGFSVYERQPGYIEAHVIAMAEGWLERQSDQGRRWICPRCSGK